jgi:hypothetical protein
MASVGQPYVDAAHLSADRAAAFALMLEATTAGGWFSAWPQAPRRWLRARAFSSMTGPASIPASALAAWASRWHPSRSNTPEIDIRKPPYNAKGDAWRFSDGTIDAGALDRITFANARWKASAVTVGNPSLWGPVSAVARSSPRLPVFAPDTILLADHAAAPVVSAR